MVGTSVLLSRKALPLASVPISTSSNSGEYEAWVNKLVQDALGLVGSMNRWRLSTSQQKDTVQTYTLPCSHSGRDAQTTPEGGRPALQVHKDELWAGRRSLHFIPRVRRASLTGVNIGEAEEEEELERNGGGLFEAFEEGLLRRHTEHEKQYIESLKEVERVGVVREGEAEVWKMVYSMPSPLSPRTFVELVIAKELPPIPNKLPPGFHTNHLPRPCRQFMVISLPIDDRNSSLPSPPYSADMGTPGSSTPPSPGSGIATPESLVSPTTPGTSRQPMNGGLSTSSSGGKDKTVRARYVSVEWVREVDLQLAGFEHGEIDGGPRVVRGVEWVMATSSSAGGNVPQAVTNMSLPSKITEDVPAFLAWVAKKSPQLGKIESKKL